ncbi:sigma-54-dependent Fis family transcriptional regulator [Amorphus sp. 3PC139-8]
MDAWENFVARGETKPAGLPVRQLIQDSWCRSADGGIDANGTEAPLCIDDGEIERLQMANVELLSAAQRPFATIGRMLEGSGAMLVLADRDGVMIEAVGDRKVLTDGEDINLVIGGKWNEDDVGTNGIGTAIWAGQPVVVHAAEHFCAGIKSWTCAGAPVRDPFDGRIIGVVDLSGHPSIFKPHNIALVMATAREIEKALEGRQREERANLLEAFVNLAPRYQSADGLLILNERGRVIYQNNVPKKIADEIAFNAFDLGDTLPRFDHDRAEAAYSLIDASSQATTDFQVNRLTLADGRSGLALVFPSTASGTSPPRGGGRRQSARSGRLASRPATSIVGESEALLEAIDVALSVAAAPTTTSLLIEGETGVGKELFARLVHDSGPTTAASSFVALNCGAVTRELFGSELFGHAGGAFTGASRDGKPGVFEQADGGTLSLDEIGEMPLEVQPFLLRVLEERAVRRIGEARSRPVDTRLIASTNRNLREESDAGRFRLDLYYRLATVSIRVPPLRARGEDVLLLMEHFNQKCAEAMGRDLLHFSDEAVERLLAYSWPGNVRELRNLIDRLHILAKTSVVGLQDLPSEITAPDREPEQASDDRDAALHADPAAARPLTSFADAEKEALRAALHAEGGNLSRVALRLGISRPTLYRKMEQYNITKKFT